VYRVGSVGWVESARPTGGNAGSSSTEQHVGCAHAFIREVTYRRQIKITEGELKRLKKIKAEVVFRPTSKSEE
jgi:hypothetical protein